MADKIERWFEVYQGRDGDWWWRYKKRVGGVINIMATSGEGYKNVNDCYNGVREMQSGPNTADIREV